MKMTIAVTARGKKMLRKYKIIYKAALRFDFTEIEAASNLLLKVRELEKPCKACKTEERDVESPSPTSEEVLPEGVVSLEETIKILKFAWNQPMKAVTGALFTTPIAKMN